MNQSDAMRLRQRRRHLAKDMNHPRGWLRTIEANEVLEIHARQILHGVVEVAVRCLAVIENRDRIGMRELAGQLHFALEPADTLGARSVRREQLDRGWPAQHGMA